MTNYTTLLSYSSLGLAGYALAWIAYARLFHPLKHIPGPFWASISRLWMVHHLWRGDMDVVQRELHQKYGPLVRIGPDEIACAAPEAMSKIYPTSNPLAKQHGFYSVWQNKSFSKYPDNFSNTDERLHSERRKIVNNVYSMSTILSLEPYIDDCSRLFVKRMGGFADSGAVVDLGDWLQWYVRSSSNSQLRRTHCDATGMRSTSSESSTLESSLDSWRTRMITEATSPRATLCCLF
jgi:hypothetical protein